MSSVARWPCARIVGQSRKSDVAIAAPRSPKSARAQTKSSAAVASVRTTTTARALKKMSK